MLFNPSEGYICEIVCFPSAYVTFNDLLCIGSATIATDPSKYGMNHYHKPMRYNELRRYKELPIFRTHYSSKLTK